MCNTLDPRNSDEVASLIGKAVIVTGGTTGIGRAIARCLVENGAQVLICGRHKAELEEALASFGDKGEAHGIVVDVSRQEDVEKLFAEADRHAATVAVMGKG